MSSKLTSKNTASSPRIAFIGGGNMAQALGLGLIRDKISAANVVVVDPSPIARKPWEAVGVSVKPQVDQFLAEYDLWVFAVKPQQLKEVITSCRPFLQQNTLILSVAAGIRATDIAQWLGCPERPFQRVVR